MDIFTFVLHHSTWISPKALGFMKKSSQRKDFTGLHENFSPLWIKDFKGLQAPLLPPSHSSSTFWNSFSEFFKGSSLTEGCFFCQKLPIYSQTIIKRAGFDTGSTIYQLHPLRFSCSVVSDSLWPHGLQHARPPCPSPTPRAYSNLCSLSQWCHPTILILCRPLLFPPSIFPSIRVFSNESVLHTRWPKYWSFSVSISPSNEYSGLISFRMDWLDLLAVQRTLKSLLQHHSSKTSILWRSAFFIVQLFISIHAAAAAKLFQLCPTLCDPIDCSPPGSPVPGILQARTLEWVAISFSNAWKWKWSRSAVSDY